jgi:hypothetical protein
MVVLGLIYLSYAIYRKKTAKPVEEIVVQPNEIIELNKFIEETSEIQNNSNYNHNNQPLHIERDDIKNPLI